MTTANDILRLAASEIGASEIPDGSNHTKFSIWYGYDAAWCNMFVDWVFYHSGMPIGPAPKGAAWVSTTADWFAQKGRYHKGTDGLKPGDILFFEWGSTPGGYDHIGLCEQVNGDTIVTIEGNVGNRVQRLVRHRITGGIDAYARPAYAIPPAPKPPVVKDWFDMATEADLKGAIADALAPIKADVAALKDKLEKIDRSFYSGMNPGKRDLYEITSKNLVNTNKLLAVVGGVQDDDLSTEDLKEIMAAQQELMNILLKPIKDRLDTIIGQTD